MEKKETLVRPGNILFFLALEKHTTVRAAAKETGVSQQHTARLLLVWRRANWVRRESTLHGRCYRFTLEGQKIRHALFGLQDVGLL